MYIYIYICVYIYIYYYFIYTFFLYIYYFFVYIDKLYSLLIHGAPRSAKGAPRRKRLRGGPPCKAPCAGASASPRRSPGAQPVRSFKAS